MRPRAFAILSMLSSEMLVSPRSTDPMYVRWSLQRSANDSWENPASFRSRRMARPSLTLSVSMVGSVPRHPA